MDKKQIGVIAFLFFIVVTGVIYYKLNITSKDELLIEDVLQENAIVSKDSDNMKDETDNKESFSNGQVVDQNNNSSLNENKIFVHVCGEVNNPGVYELDDSSRVVDAIRSAGGLTKDADSVSVNQAKTLKDSEQVYIPKQGENTKHVENNATENEGDIDEGGKININSATKEELMSLPGIGEAKACKIIDYRESEGSFSKIEDIMKITGIKEGLFKKISEYIIV